MPSPLQASLGLSSTSVSTSSQIPDDRPALVDAILLADALIISAPVYTRQPAGILKAFTDTALGPFVDAGAMCTEWGSLALPGLQQSVFSLHAKVVDQVIVRGCPYPGR
jgi:multimeric flavodoxin WrbA